MPVNIIRIVTSNVQRLHEKSKRSNLFQHWSKSTKADLFLLSEVGSPSFREAAAWTKECRSFGLDGLFYPDCKAAIVWRPSSPFFTAKAPKDTQKISSTLAVSNRSVDAVFEICGQEYTVISVYVSVYEKERPQYLDNLAAKLRKSLQGKDFFVAGDWNCVPAPAIDSDKPVNEKKPNKGNKGTVQLHNLIRQARFVDAYRTLYPEKVTFTNVSPGDAANRRLDHIYVSAGMAGNINKVYHWEKGRSTHLPVVLSWLVPGAIPIGPSWFKVPPDLFEDSVRVVGIKSMITACWDRAGLVFQKPNERWNYAKELLKPRLSHLSSILAKQRTVVDPNALALRARLPADLVGPASIHIRLRQVRAQDLVESIQSKEGVRLDHPDDMLGECMSFFEDLYKSEPISKPDCTDLLENLETKVEEGDRLALEQPFVKEVLEIGLKSANSKSAPGPDGLSYLFYAATWEVTGPILAECMNALFLGTEPYPEHVTNLVLLHKDGDKDQLRNKRPISLINVDERLMDKAINFRVAKLLPKLIHPDQTGFIPGRWIGENIEAVQNLIEEGNKYQGVLASVDFEKAYDRVEHAYLEAVLIKFGFGPNISRAMMGSSTNTKARILLNGWLSGPVSIERGVRQGSPLAPSLFALCMEPLAAKLRKDLVGIRHTGLIPQSQTKIQPFKASLFADDLSNGLCGQKDLPKLEGALDMFEKAGGGRRNQQKSFVYGIGLTLKGPDWHGWRIQKGPFRHLGVRVGIGVKVEEIWSEMADKVEARMRSIPMFDLSLAAKCSVINVYCYTKILFLDQFIPAPENIVKRIQTAAAKAIKGGKAYLISEKHLTTPVGIGGFGLVPLETKLQCARAKWIVKLLQPGWKEYRYLAARRVSMAQRVETLTAVRHGFTHPVWTRQDEYRGSGKPFARYAWRWPAVFFQPLYALGWHWRKAFLEAKSQLPYRWQLYTEAWVDLTSCAIFSQSQFEKEVLIEDYTGFACTVDLKRFQIEGLPKEKFKYIGLLAGKIVEANSEYYGPAWDVDQVLSRKKAEKFWKVMKQVRNKSPTEHETLHLYVIGRLQEPWKWKKTTFAAPYNTSERCCLCLEDKTETILHAYIECHVSRRLRIALGLHSFNYRDLTIAGTLMADEPDGMLLILNARLIHILHKLIMKRRLGKSPPSIITDKQIEDLALLGIGSYHN